MADVRPFCAYRPRKGLESRIAALPYDVYDRAEAEEEVRKEPLSFLRIDRAETGMPEGIASDADCVYERARDILHKMLASGEFVQDEELCYYLYELTRNGRCQTGIVACVSIDDYCSGVILRHENTRREKEEDRVRHVDTCDMQTGPIFLAYREEKELCRIREEWKKSREPVNDFISPDGIRHRVWVIDDAKTSERIRECFGGMSRIYIADGHHRCASAVRVGMKRRREAGTYNGEEAFNYFLSVLFSERELEILDYNRVVKDLNGHGTEEFLEKVKERFKVCAEGSIPVKPRSKGEFGMYLKGGWYRLTAAEQPDGSDPVRELDVSVLQENLLEPVLGIADPRTDERIDFVGGIRGLKGLEQRVNSDGGVAFSLYPTSIQELFAVADAGELMPPKSTWFEPKLRSGLFLHALW
ncbi:MAG: DUF1015 domain-containing protein [Lachnospiraceae bacterium]|nr:DUF1015 domain-containing protein [Lachnospiraceae bacterium]